MNDVARPVSRNIRRQTIKARHLLQKIRQSPSRKDALAGPRKDSGRASATQSALSGMFNAELRRAMRDETLAYFDYVVRENRDVTELIDSNYTFVNETLAKHYGIEGVKGDETRRVELPAGSPRGGVLTQGTLLGVTSNPSRTSPVKRGLFILDNILGSPPPPPPPPNVPILEVARDSISDHQPTIRESQELHRREPLCKSCHARMDPLGLALENFNAMGMWRDTEQGLPIDASGELMTGEKFSGIRELKTIIKDKHRLDFYRCLSEKLLTYALGRGLEYYDEHTVDLIVAKLDRGQGKFSALLMGIVESAPFQKQRRAKAVAAGSVGTDGTEECARYDFEACHGKKSESARISARRWSLRGFAGVAVAVAALGDSRMRRPERALRQVRRRGRRCGWRLSRFRTA